MASQHLAIQRYTHSAPLLPSIRKTMTRIKTFTSPSHLSAVYQLHPHIRTRTISSTTTIPSSCSSSALSPILHRAEHLSTPWPPQSHLHTPFLALNNASANQPMTTNFILSLPSESSGNTPRTPRVLLLHRRPEAHVYAGKWSAVSGRLERTPTTTLHPRTASGGEGKWYEAPIHGALREIGEEIGIDPRCAGVEMELELLTALPPREISSAGQKKWMVWTLLWRLHSAEEGRRVVRLNEENDGFKWVGVNELGRWEGLIPGLEGSLGRLLEAYGIQVDGRLV